MTHHRHAKDWLAISVESRKGGVGKTTLALYLSSALLDRGWDVLFLDLDIGGTSAAVVQESLSQVQRSVWRNRVSVVREGDPAGGQAGNIGARPLNLMDVFEDYMSGSEAHLGQIHWSARRPGPALAAPWEMRPGLINLFPSYLRRFDGQPYSRGHIYYPAMLFDEMHSRWFLTMIKGMVQRSADAHAAATANEPEPKRGLAVVLDNSPGYSGFSPEVEEWLTDLGPERGKFLFVTTQDTQDQVACWESLVDVHELVEDKWLASRELLGLLQAARTTGQSGRPDRQERFFSRLCETGPQDLADLRACCLAGGAQQDKCTSCQLCYYRRDQSPAPSPPSAWHSYLAMIVNKAPDLRRLGREYDYGEVLRHFQLDDGHDPAAAAGRRKRKVNRLEKLWREEDKKPPGREELVAKLTEYLHQSDEDDEDSGHVIPFNAAMLYQFAWSSSKTAALQDGEAGASKGKGEPPDCPPELQQAVEEYRRTEAPQLDKYPGEEYKTSLSRVAEAAGGLTRVFDRVLERELGRAGDRDKELTRDLGLKKNLSESLHGWFIGVLGSRAAGDLSRRSGDNRDQGSSRDMAARLAQDGFERRDRSEDLIKLFYDVIRDNLKTEKHRGSNLDILEVVEGSVPFAGLAVLAARENAPDGLELQQAADLASSAAWLSVLLVEETREHQSSPRYWRQPDFWRKVGRDREAAHGLASKVARVFPAAGLVFRSLGGDRKHAEWYQNFCAAAGQLIGADQLYPQLLQVCRMLLKRQARVDLDEDLLRGYAVWLVRSDQKTAATTLGKLHNQLMRGIAGVMRDQISEDAILDSVFLSPDINPISRIMHGVLQKDWAITPYPQEDQEGQDVH